MAQAVINEHNSPVALDEVTDDGFCPYQGFVILDWDDILSIVTCIFISLMTLDSCNAVIASACECLVEHTRSVDGDEPIENLGFAISFDAQSFLRQT